MRLLVKVESYLRSEIFEVESTEGMQAVRNVGPQLMRWLTSLVAGVGTSGVCKSFTVSAHVEHCDHEAEVPHG